MNSDVSLKLLKNIESSMIGVMASSSKAKSIKKEVRLVLKIMGVSKGTNYEDAKRQMTPTEIECLLSLQRANTTMLVLGCEYDKRKEDLGKLYQRIWLDKLTQERIMLEG